MIINKNNLCKNKNHINYKHVISILIIINGLFKGQKEDLPC